MSDSVVVLCGVLAQLPEEISCRESCTVGDKNVTQT